jgi:hypothetical protein
MINILILIGMLLLVSMIQTALYQRKQNSLQSQSPPPPYDYPVENPYFQRPYQYGYPISQPNALQNNEPSNNSNLQQVNRNRRVQLNPQPSEEAILQHKKEQNQQGIFYTLLFLLGLIALLLSN